MNEDQLVALQQLLQANQTTPDTYSLLQRIKDQQVRSPAALQKIKPVNPQTAIPEDAASFATQKGIPLGEISGTTSTKEMFTNPLNPTEAEEKGKAFADYARAFTGNTRDLIPDLTKDEQDLLGKIKSQHSLPEGSKALASLGDYVAGNLVGKPQELIGKAAAAIPEEALVAKEYATIKKMLETAPTKTMQMIMGIGKAGAQPNPIISGDTSNIKWSFKTPAPVKGTTYLERSGKEFFKTYKSVFDMNEALARAQVDLNLTGNYKAAKEALVTFAKSQIGQRLTNQELSMLAENPAYSNKLRSFIAKRFEGDVSGVDKRELQQLIGSVTELGNKKYRDGLEGFAQSMVQGDPNKSITIDQARSYLTNRTAGYKPEKIAPVLDVPKVGDVRVGKGGIKYRLKQLPNIKENWEIVK